jgi:hypothetical protein
MAITSTENGSGKIWALSLGSLEAPFTNTLLVDTALNIASFGLDANNELYFTAFDGKIYTLSQPADVSAPTIGVPLQAPLNPTPQDEVEISINISDPSGIREVTLSYRNDSVWNNVSMTQIASGTFSANIPAMPYQTIVEYKIIAYDNFNNSAVSDNQGLLYSYTVVPEFPSGAVVAVLMASTLLTAAVIKKRKTTFRRLFSSW